MGAEARKKSEQDFQAVCEDALDDAGYILTHTNAAVAGNVKLVDTAGEPPVGVNLMSTKSPITKVAEANKRVTILDDGDAWVKLEPNTSRTGAIAVDSWIQGSGNGMAELLTMSAFADIEKVLGISRQEVADTVDLPTAGEKPYKTGYLLVKLSPRLT